MRAVTRLLLLAALPALAGRAGGEVLVSGAGPAFVGTEAGAGAVPSSVVAARGQDVELQCAVLRLGDRAVSWVRSRDLQILSHAGAVFTADARVSVRVDGERDRERDRERERERDRERERGREAARAGEAGVTRHALRIRRLRLADGGRYECQLNTEPKMSLFFNLTVVDEPVPVVVVEAEAAAVRGAAGGAAVLRCAARYQPPPRALPLPPLDIRWAKDGRPLTAQEGVERGVWVQAERWAARARSALTLAALRPADAGRYTCSAGTAHTAHTAAEVLLLLDNESPMEAMQRDQSTDAAPRSRRLAALALALTVAAPYFL